VIFPWIFLTGSRRRNGANSIVSRSTVHCLNSSCLYINKMHMRVLDEFMLKADSLTILENVSTVDSTVPSILA
jgi:hypothetical protein